MHDDLEIYKEAIQLWGKAAQRLMLIEECMVDVQIMVNQIRALIDDESMWERTFTDKIARLRERIERDKPVAKEA